MSERDIIIACGALARELIAVFEANKLTNIELRCLPALLHNRPEAITPAVADAIAAARPFARRLFVAYADCGTGGALDLLLEKEGVERLPGAHCYQFFSGMEAFVRRGDADMRSFFLTDFLARQFDTLVIEGLGLDRHPELRDMYFGQYERVVHLAQTEDEALRAAGEAAAKKLALAYEYRFVGYGEMPASIRRFARA